jgi:hypothetical protein
METKRTKDRVTHRSELITPISGPVAKARAKLRRMSEETLQEASDNTLPPTPDVSLYGLGNREAILDLARLPFAHPDAIARVRSFLVRCLILAYGISRSEIPDDFPGEEWVHFIRLFQIRVLESFDVLPTDTAYHSSELFETLSRSFASVVADSRCSLTDT